MVSTIEKITIDDTEIFMDDLGNGQGKLTISNTWGHNYSYFWGSMGSDLRTFIKDINSSYFADKLLGHKHERVIDLKATFKNVRHHIVHEMDLPYYKHMEFQKNMREVLRDFQNSCEDYGGKYRFVECFHSHFVNSLDYYLIDCIFDRKSVKSDFEGICEQWHFLEEKPSPEYFWLEKFHTKLKKALK